MEIISTILALVGILLGWALNEISQYIRQRKENTKELKALLFHLLNVYFFLIRIKIFKLKLAEIVELIKKNVPSNNNDNGPKTQLEEVFETYFDVRNKDNPFTDALTSYKQCVERIIGIG
ncbi:hypothetical protein [Leptospira adleri]|uniref:Uncharacterized protein n=1 Tax=Leptospira adleri TaxID=2023186 RepID=A0A2M9YI18_9LEPT|nr:hypothetical protein [Leptospira adleri]PJZ51193.1 hypothetical protein CH380_21390 [Leptospira adleri]PJZ59422.1 hypothetical protein CH376_23795 [Leptospira adleri]